MKVQSAVVVALQQEADKCWCSNPFPVFLKNVFYVCLCGALCVSMVGTHRVQKRMSDSLELEFVVLVIRTKSACGLPSTLLFETGSHCTAQCGL